MNIASKEMYSSTVEDGKTLIRTPKCTNTAVNGGYGTGMKTL